MDASPTPRHATRLALEINRTVDGRLEGQIGTAVAGPWRTFSGVLELLKVLEETLDLIEVTANIHTRKGTES